MDEKALTKLMYVAVLCVATSYIYASCTEYPKELSRLTF